MLFSKILIFWLIDRKNLHKKSHFRENCFHLVEMAGTAPASNRANRVILLIIEIFE